MIKNRLLPLLLAVSMLLCLVLALASCGGNEGGGGENNPADNGKADYSITVVDSEDAPLSGVIVKIFDNGALYNMYVTDTQGNVTVNLPKKDYTVEIDFIGGYAFTYDESAVKLSADKTSTTVKLYRGLPAPSLSIVLSVGGGGTASMITNGTYTLNASAEMTYIVFEASQRGRHLISVSGGASVSYHGNPMFVQENDLTEAEDKADNGCYIDVRSYHLPGAEREASKFVIGVRSDTPATVELKIENVADLPLDLQEIPYNDHTMIKAPDVYDLPDNVTLVDLDLTDADLTVIYNEEDGFYHYGTVDGPVVLIRLATATPNNANFAGFSEMFAHNGFTGFNCYIFDDEGNFVSKEQYHNMMVQYIEAVDPDTGVYPLTRNIAEAIQNYGAANGWWEESAANRFFGAAILDFAEGKAWLFACCYAAVLE